MALLRRSLSDSLLLEDDYVSVEGLEYTDVHFHEDYEIVGASGLFDLKRNEQKKNEAVDILKLIDNDKELMKHGLKSSKSLESLDTKAPNEVWKDSYDKLYNAKVKKFMKGNKAVKENRHGRHNGPVTTQTLDRKSKVNVAALLENADQMRLTPYETEPDNQVGPYMEYHQYDSDTLLQGSDLVRSAKIKPNIASDVPSHHSTMNLTNVDSEINLRGGTYTDPKVDIGINIPDSSLTLPDTQRSPVMHLTKGHFKGPKAVLNSSDMDMEVPSVNVKKPKFKMPKFSLSGNKNTDISYDGSMKGSKFALSSPEVAPGLKGSNIQIDGPKADFKGLKTDLPDMDMSSGKLKAPTFSFPDFGLSGPKIKTPDYDLKTPKMNLSAPKFKADFDSPDINIRGHKPDITAPDMDVNIPEGTFKGPNFKKPNLDLNAPDLDINVPSGNLKLPKFGFSGSKPEGPDLKIKSPDLNLKSPKIKGGIDTPDMDLTLPQTDLKGPNLDFRTPDIDVNSPSGKFNMPKLKMPSFGLSGLKGPHMNMDADIDKPDVNLSASTPRLNAGINSPDIDIHRPNVDLKGPKTDLTLPDMDIPSGKMKVPTFKMPDFGLSGTKIKTPDCDLKNPEMDLSAPKFKADFDSPDINIRGHKPDIKTPDLNVDFPKGQIKGPNFKKPNLDVNAPDLDINAPSGKLKLPKFGISGSKQKGPDLKIKSPDLNLKSPKIKGGIDTPDMDLTFPQTDLKGPNLDIKSPDIDVSGPSGKLNMPKLKMPSFGLSGLKGPHMNMDADIDQSDLNLSASTPKLNAGINSPDIDIHGPNVDLKGPKTDLTLPDIDRPSGKMKMPNFKMPDFGLSAPKIKTPDYDLKTPELDLSAPKFKANFDSPDINIRGHNPDLTAPDMNVDFPKGKIKGPNFKKPNLDMNGLGLDINAPSNKLKLPKFGFSGSKPKGPDLKIKSPDLNLKSPKIKGGIDTPDMDLTLPKTDLRGPNFDIKSPDIDVNGPSGKLNMPKFKMPSFGMSGLKGPHMNVDADIDQPDFNLSASTPKLNAGINSPDIDLHGPNVDLKGPRTDLTLPDMDIPSGKMKMPAFKMPDIGFSGPKIKKPDYDLKTPKMDHSAPKIHKTDITAPDMNVDFPKGKINRPNYKKPSVDVNETDFDIDAPSGKLKLQGNMPEGRDLKFTSPKMNLKTPRIKGGIDSSDFQGLGSDVDFGTYTEMHANSFAVPRGKTEAAKTYDLDDLSRDIRIPTHQKYGAPELNMQDPYYDLNRDMNVSEKAQWSPIPEHLSSQSRISGVGPTSSGVYNTYNGMPRRGGWGSEQTGYSGRQTMRHMQIHAMDLEVPESTLKGSKFNVLKLI
ncbi:neuroblast differentiation-associated protein AHNAK-like [Sinocyclocheilus grahami]|uniref:neuroblast differentiation-associated protein AHNAK-like n=1 Tax=Sinocyclocheilus grahami TaxID=75366 RepID=UPI0007AC97A1|nr:PREDICTED: neuroblast differentiation-associated protein AHNAK-like [Sinocyclocheilus grahami]